MSLDIQQRELEGIQILDMKGRLTVGEESTKFRDAVRRMAEAGVTNAILNLKQLDYIDSTGLGGMVVCYTTFSKAGGALKLVNLNKRNIELLFLTKLITIFELFNDEQDAINSFFPGREVKSFDILDFVQGSDQGS
ncbi:MAG: STAS domain-containing protein [Acidobacteriia bacterium]|nr:STAS domain-containing protein [Terriglobia bacterium]